MANEPTVPIRLSAGSSLIATREPFCAGTLLYRGVTYQVEIDGCPGGYSGNGIIRGLRSPEAVAGDYTMHSGGGSWRNRNGVEIDLTPPIQTFNNSGQLKIRYSGAALPRQP
jgi:hypothetical protein